MTKNARHRARQHEAGRALQRAAARPRVAGRRDLPAHARLLRRQLRPRPARRATTQGNPIAGLTAEEVTQLVDTRELWFACISNPDGYEYTFTAGQPAVAQEHGRQRRRRDPRRGRGRRRPEPQLLHQLGPRQRGLLGRPDLGDLPRHRARPPSPRRRRCTACGTGSTSCSRRTTTRRPSCCSIRSATSSTRTTPDNGIFEALAGNDVDSAIADKAFDEGDPEDRGRSWRSTDSPLDADTSVNRFDPDLVGRAVHHQRRHARRRVPQHGILGFTPEGSEPADENVSGFEFQDDEDDIEAEFQRHLLFSLDLARSAADPANPSSHLGNGVEDFYVDDFAVSYGDPQSVEVSAKRSLGDVRLRYRINDGRVQQAPTKEAPGGERFNNEKGVYFQRLRGEVKGTQPGDEVEVWFESDERPGALPALHLHGQEGERQQGARPRRRGLPGRQPGAGSRRAALPQLLHRRARRERASATTSTTSTAWATRLRTPWAC